MRVANLRIKEVHEEIFGQAIENGNALMDGVVRNAQARCPIGSITREGGWKTATVAFTPTTRRRRALPEHQRARVSFEAQQWTGRQPEQLRDTIRRVNSYYRPGNIRVYAGNKKVNYAHFVEYGTRKMTARPFLRPPFESAKIVAEQVLKNGA